jgi:hypothetical protein
MPEDPANQALTAASLGIDPAAYAAQMRKQQIAQFLTQDALTPVQQEQPAHGVGPYYVQARTRPLTAISKLVEAVMSNKFSKDANTGNAQMMGQMLQQFSPGGSPQSGGVAPNSGAAAPAAPLAGYQGGAGASDVTPQVAAAAPQAVNPMNPTGLPAGPLTRLFLTAPDKYIEAIKGTPDWQNALQANGGNVQAARAQLLKAAQAAVMTPEAKNALAAIDPSLPPDARAAIHNSMLTPEARNANFAFGQDSPEARGIVGDKAIKDATGEARAGGILRIPDPAHPGQFTFVRAPNTGTNQDVVLDSTGNPVSTHLIPGSLGAVGALKGTEEAAAQSNELREITLKDGTKAWTRVPLPPAVAPGAALARPPAGAPPAPGAPAGGPPGAAKPPVPNYFPSAQGIQQSPGGKEYQTETGKESGQFASDLADDSNGALEVRRSLHEMANLAQQQSPNASNTLRAHIYRMAVAGGVSPETAQAFTGLNGGALEAAQKQTSGLAVSSIHQMTNRGTNFDLQTFMENNPNLLQSPGGFQRVLDYMDSKSASIIDKQRQFQAYVKANPNVPPEERKADFTAAWNAKQEEAISKGKYDSRNTNTIGPSKAEIEAEARRRGLIK